MREIKPQQGLQKECVKEELHSKGHTIVRCTTHGVRVYDWDSHVMEHKINWLATKFTVRG